MNMPILFTLFSQPVVKNVFSFILPLVEVACLFLKAYILFKIMKATGATKRTRMFYYFVAILVAGMTRHVSLLFMRLGDDGLALASPRLFRSMLRFDFGSYIIQIFVLFSFFKEFTSQPLKSRLLSLFHRFAALMTLSFCGYFLYWGFYTLFTNALEISSVSQVIMRCSQIFFLLEGFLTIVISRRNYVKEKLALLQHHIHVLGMYFMVPYLVGMITETELVAPTLTIGKSTIIVNPLATVFTSLWLTAMLFYCSWKLTGLRFLNMRSHVASRATEKFAFFEVFKGALRRLGALANPEDVVPVTKEFFEGVFKISSEKIHIFFRSPFEGVHDRDAENEKKHYIEQALSGDDDESKEVRSYVNEHNILIRDEIEFTHFSIQKGREKERLGSVVHFLKSISADIFLPIYSDAKLVAYLIVERGARPNRLYTDVERDEMLVFCNYLGSFIYLLSTINLETLQARERALRFELHKKERQLGLLKKSIYPFIGVGQTRKVGVLTFKANKFAYANQAAKDLLSVDLNKEKGLTLTQVLTGMSTDTASFLSPRRSIITTPQGQRLVAVSTPNVLKNNTIVTVSNPTLADTVKDHLHALKHADKWDYLLALKSSDEGNLVNQLLPSDSPTILSCKLALLEQASNEKAMLIEVTADEDATQFAQVAYRLGKRGILHEFALKRNADDEGLMCTIFGMNPIFRTDQEKSLFEQLHGKGTLVLHHIHLLSLNVQHKLLEYIRSGRYTPYKSDQSKEGDVSLICTTTQDLQGFVQRGLFLKDLYNELSSSSVWLPSLATLPDDEYLELSEGIRSHLVQAKVYENMLTFTDYDRRKLLASRCVSIHELKSKVHNLIQKKLRKQSIGSEAIIDPAYGVVDPDLAQAARLGKHALKDPKMLTMLMKKFNQSQTNIAQFLGVNRSTVSRRCAQFGIEHIPEASSQKKQADESSSI